MVFTHDCHDHADGELGDCLRGVGGDADYVDAETGGGGEVDVVEAGAAEGDVFLEQQRWLLVSGGVLVLD